MRDPILQAWIDDYSKTLDKPHEDCRYCSYPHAKSTVCGMGGTFGQVRIGDHFYYIDGSNVDSMIHFVKAGLGNGFHWKKERVFCPTSEGVRVTHYTKYNNTPQKVSWLIPWNEWESIVGQMQSPTAPSTAQPAGLIGFLLPIELQWLNEARTADRNCVATINAQRDGERTVPVYAAPSTSQSAEPPLEELREQYNQLSAQVGAQIDALQGQEACPKELLAPQPVESQCRICGEPVDTCHGSHSCLQEFGMYNVDPAHCAPAQPADTDTAQTARYDNLRAVFHASMMKAYPDKSHKEITDAIDAALAGVGTPSPSNPK